MCSRANRTQGFLRRNLSSCPQDVKEAAYKTLVRPILEYGSTAWDPHCNGLYDELENVQKCAARFVTRNYSYETGSMTGILEELKWETLPGIFLVSSGATFRPLSQWDLGDFFPNLKKKIPNLNKKNFFFFF